MKKFLMLAPAILPVTLLAQEFYATKPATIECVVEAANRQGVPANVLLAIILDATHKSVDLQVAFRQSRGRGSWRSSEGSR